MKPFALWLASILDRKVVQRLRAYARRPATKRKAKVIRLEKAS